MDFDPRQDAGEFRERPCGQPCAAVPQPVANPVTPDGVHARVGEDHLQRGRGGRIPLLGCLYVTPYGREHGYSAASANSGVLRYRSPKSGSTTTTSLPAFSGRRATCRAATTAAPDEMPTRSPSSLASRRARLTASSLPTVTTSSMRSSSYTPGTNPAPMPWIG